jgi:protein phosphatase 2C family protein 2/3
MPDARGAGGTLGKALRAAIAQTEEEWLTRAREQQDESGSTVAMAAFSGRTLYTALLGDCRIVLSRAGKAIELTKDQKCNTLEERMRVEALGGHVEFNAVNGELEVSRSVGDSRVATGRKLLGLSAEPEVGVHYLADDDEFIIIACDGLWDALSSEQAVGMARRSLAEYNDIQKASADLVREALRRYVTLF